MPGDQDSSATHTREFAKTGVVVRRLQRWSVLEWGQTVQQIPLAVLVVRGCTVQAVVQLLLRPSWPLNGPSTHSSPPIDFRPPNVRPRQMLLVPSSTPGAATIARAARLPLLEDAAGPFAMSSWPGPGEAARVALGRAMETLESRPVLFLFHCLAVALDDSVTYRVRILE